MQSTINRIFAHTARQFRLSPDPQVSTRKVRQKDNRMSGWFLPENGQICEGFLIDEHDTVIDVGCGDGNFANFAARRKAKVIATDICPDSVERAHQKLARSHAREFETHVSDSTPLPIRDSIASKVICCEVLEHVDDPTEVMSELVRVGAPGATYLITVPDPVGESIHKKIAPPVYWGKPNHLRVFERDEFHQLLVDAGLEVQSRTFAGFYWSMWWILFWGSKQEFGEPEKPLLANWTATWNELISDPDNDHIKEALDQFMPKSQILVAKKPC